MEYQRKPINIPGLERWEVDTEGTVYNLNGTPRKYSLNHSGYCIVSFVTKDKKRISVAVHTIVAKTFLPKPSEDCWQVNHKNGNKTKNNVENLEWVTPVENVHHAIDVLGNDQTGANNINARKIIARDKKTGELKYQFDSLIDAAKFLATENQNPRRIQNCIWQVLQKRYGKKSYRGCTWEYADDKIVNGPPKKDVLVE